MMASSQKSSSRPQSADRNWRRVPPSLRHDERILQMTKPKYAVFAALDPYFKLGRQGLAGVVDGDHYFDIIADFAVPDRHLAIYVDSAAFHTGARLRLDHIIRSRLREGMLLVALRPGDLARGAALVQELANR